MNYEMYYWNALSRNFQSAYLKIGKEALLWTKDFTQVVRPWGNKDLSQNPDGTLSHRVFEQSSGVLKRYDSYIIEKANIIGRKQEKKGAIIFYVVVWLAASSIDSDDLTLELEYAVTLMMLRAQYFGLLQLKACQEKWNLEPVSQLHELGIF